MNCGARNQGMEPEPMMTESLLSLMSRGARIRVETVPEPPVVVRPNAARRQETPEQRRLRLKRVLEAAAKITESYDYFDNDDESPSFWFPETRQ